MKDVDLIVLSNYFRIHHYRLFWSSSPSSLRLPSALSLTGGLESACSYLFLGVEHCDQKSYYYYSFFLFLISQPNFLFGSCVA